MKNQSLLEWCISTNSKLCEEWDIEKNCKLTPNDISYGSSKVVWWLCNKHKHSWNSTVKSRTLGRSKCPYCSNKRVLIGYNDLETTHPHLAKEWNYAKNGDLKPTNVVAGKKRTKVSWICSKCGNEWEATISNRAKLNSGCPYCANTKVITGHNDLQSKNPELAIEWDYSKNGKLKPSDVSAGYTKNVWWLCPRCGNEWLASVSSRTHGSGCPRCKSSFQFSFNEKTIAYYISKIIKIEENYHDNCLGNFEIDIYIPSIKYGIEYDGVRYHNNKKSRINDEKKIMLCKKNNIMLIHVREEGLNELFGVKNYFVSARKTTQSLESVITEILNEICYLVDLKPPSVNINRDEVDILKNISSSEKKNSLQSKYPELLKEWNYELNNPIRPDSISSKCHHKIWWRCSKCNYEWKSDVSSRTEGHGCPKCAGKILEKGVNDLETLYPKIAKEWNYELNEGITPSDVSGCSNNKYYWKGKCGHIWLAKVGARTKNNTGCPFCSNPPTAILPGFNDLLTRCPELALEWDYEHNNVDPSKIGVGHTKKVWWICSKCGHRWGATVNN